MLSDKIIQQLNRQDAHGLVQVYRHFRIMVYDTVYAITSNKEVSEDITQDVFLKLWEATHKREFANYNNLAAWLHLKSTNASLNWIRDHNRYVERNKAAVREHFRASESDLVRAELLRMIELEVEKMQPELRTVYNLVHKQGYSVAEAAKMLDLTVQGLYKRINNLTAQLRKAFLDNKDVPAHLVVVMLSMLISLEEIMYC